MTQVMGMFGKNMASHFLFIFTFSDLHLPHNLPNLRKFLDGAIKDKEDWFLTVNNSAFFLKIQPDNPMENHFFQLGMKSLEKTIDKLI